MKDFSKIGPPAHVDVEAIAQKIMFRDGILALINEKPETDCFFESNGNLCVSRKVLRQNTIMVLFEEYQRLHKDIRAFELQLSVQFENITIE